MRPLLAVVLALSACGLFPHSPPPPTPPGPDAGGPSSPSRQAHYIRAAPFPKLVLEVDVVPGMEPRPASANGLVAGLSGLLDKPGGIAVVQESKLISRGADHAWAFADLDALAASTFDAPVASDAVKMHALFLDGHSADDTANAKVLGLAWGATHLVLFKRTLEQVCGGVALAPLVRERMCAAAELGVWTHEVGHLLGLVDNGIPMVAPHKDPDHGAHDRSDQCVMYYAYEGQSIVDLLAGRFLAGNEDPLGFDAACRADVDAVKRAR